MLGQARGTGGRVGHGVHLGVALAGVGAAPACRNPGVSEIQVVLAPHAIQPVEALALGAAIAVAPLLRRGRFGRGRRCRLGGELGALQSDVALELLIYALFQVRNVELKNVHGLDQLRRESLLEPHVLTQNLREYLRHSHVPKGAAPRRALAAKASAGPAGDCQSDPGSVGVCRQL